MKKGTLIAILALVLVPLASAAAPPAYSLECTVSSMRWSIPAWKGEVLPFQVRYIKDGVVYNDCSNPSNCDGAVYFTSSVGFFRGLFFNVGYVQKDGTETLT